MCVCVCVCVCVLLYLLFILNLLCMHYIVCFYLCDNYYYTSNELILKEVIKEVITYVKFN